MCKTGHPQTPLGIVGPGENHVLSVEFLKTKQETSTFSPPSNGRAGTCLLWKCLRFYESALEPAGGSARGSVKQRRRENLSRNNAVINIRRFEE